MSASWAKPERRRPGLFTAFAVGMAAFLVYLITLAPTVATNDAGRFQIAAPLLGTGHPTGYPTFILAGKLFTFLPFGDEAYRLNLMAAFFGGVAVGLFFLVAREIGAARGPAAGCALIFAFCMTFWDQATFAEVYSMHVMFILGVALLLLRWRSNAGAGSLVFAGLLFGVSLGNNAGMVLMAPTFLILLFAGRRPKPGALIWPALAALIGLSVYAYIPLRGFSGAWHNYGDPVNDWNDVWRLVSGARFQGLMGATPPEMVSNVGDFLGELSVQAAAPFGSLFAALALAGGLYGAATLFARNTVVGVALVVGGASTLLYALSYDIDDIAVYYLPVYTLLLVFLALAVTSLSGDLRSPAILIAPAVLAALILGLNFSTSDKSDYYVERARSEALLATLPESAILYGKLPIIPTTYLTEVEGERSDVTLRWLDGGTIERSFERDLESGRQVYFIPDERYTEEYLALAEPYANVEEENGLILLTPKSGPPGE